MSTSLWEWTAKRGGLGITDKVPVLGPWQIVPVANCVGPCRGITNVKVLPQVEEGAKDLVGLGGEIFLGNEAYRLVAKAIPTERRGGCEEDKGQ